MRSANFTIGEAAARAGVSADTIRYYERRGVLPRPNRTAGGYRLYSDDAIGRIQLVRNAVRFGFTLKELTVFLRACDAGHSPCHKVRAAGGRILAEMERRLVDMAATRDQMRSTIAAWDRALETTPAHRSARLLHSIPASGTTLRCLRQS